MAMLPNQPPPKPYGPFVNQDFNPQWDTGMYDPNMGYVGNSRDQLAHFILNHPQLTNRVMGLLHLPGKPALPPPTWNRAAYLELMQHPLGRLLIGRLGYHQVYDPTPGDARLAHVPGHGGNVPPPPPATHKPTSSSSSSSSSSSGNGGNTGPPPPNLPNAPHLSPFQIINPQKLAAAETAAQYGPQLAAVLAAIGSQRRQGRQDVLDLNNWYTTAGQHADAAATADHQARADSQAQYEHFTSGLMQALGGSASSAAQTAGSHTAPTLDKLMSDLQGADTSFENQRAAGTRTQGMLAVENQQNANRNAMTSLQGQRSALAAARGSALQANLQQAMQIRDQELAARAAAQLSGAQFGLARATTASNLQTADVQRQLLIKNGLGQNASGPAVFTGKSGLALHATAEQQLFAPLSSKTGKPFAAGEAWHQLATLAQSAGGKLPVRSQAAYNWVKNEWRAYLGQYVQYLRSHGSPNATVSQYMQPNGTPYSTAQWHKSGAKWV